MLVQKPVIAPDSACTILATGMSSANARMTHAAVRIALATRSASAKRTNVSILSAPFGRSKHVYVLLAETIASPPNAHSTMPIKMNVNAKPTPCRILPAMTTMLTRDHAISPAPMTGIRPTLKVTRFAIRTTLILIAIPVVRVTGAQ